MREYGEGNWDPCSRSEKELLRNDSSVYAVEAVNLRNFVLYAKATFCELGIVLLGSSSRRGKSLVVVTLFKLDKVVVFNISSRVIPILILCECLKCCEPIGLFVVSEVFLCCTLVEYDLSSD